MDGIEQEVDSKMWKTLVLTFSYDGQRRGFISTHPLYLNFPEIISTLSASDIAVELCSSLISRVTQISLSQTDVDTCFTLFKKSSAAIKKLGWTDDTTFDQVESQTDEIKTKVDKRMSKILTKMKNAGSTDPTRV